MADGTALAPAPTGRRPSAPDEVWDQVREAYLAGASAPDCCRTYGVGLSALRARSARDGWRRIDQPFSPPANRLDPWDEGLELEDRVDGDLDKVEPRELSWVAWRRMTRAILRGDAAEALRWRRVRIAMDEEADELDRLIAQDEALQVHRDDEAECQALRGDDDRGADAGPHPNDPDDPDGVFQTPSPLEGEGGPEGRMRGVSAADRAPAMPPSTASHPDDPDDPDGVFSSSSPLGEGDQAKPGGGAPDPAPTPPPPFTAPPGLERKGLAFPHDLLRLRPLRPRLPLRPGGEQRPRLVHRPPRRL